VQGMEPEFTPEGERQRLIESLQVEMDNINTEIVMLITRCEVMASWQESLRHGSTEPVYLPQVPSLD
jgi:hypothetical protein